MGDYNRLVKYCQCERNMDAREWQLVQSDGALSQNQSQLLSRHDDFSRMAEHLVATNVNLDHALRDFEPGPTTNIELHRMTNTILLDPRN